MAAILTRLWARGRSHWPVGYHRNARYCNRIGCRHIREVRWQLNHMCGKWKREAELDTAVLGRVA